MLWVAARLEYNLKKIVDSVIPSQICSKFIVYINGMKLWTIYGNINIL